VKLLYLLPLILLIPQAPTLTTTLDGTTIRVQFTTQANHPSGDWIALYRPGAPIEPFPSSQFWQYVPAGESGELTFTAAPGEWEARYMSPANAVLAKSLSVMVEGTPDPGPAPVPVPLPTTQTVRVLRVTIFNADGTVNVLPHEISFYQNPGEAKLGEVRRNLMAGQRAEVEEWQETIDAPTRPADVLWGATVRRVIP
jgi:hypothetical protein